MNKSINRRGKRIDFPCVITFLLFSSIYINRMNSFGSYVLIGLTLLMFFYLLFHNGQKLSISFCFFHFQMIMLACYCLLSAFWAIDIREALTKALTIFEIFICMSTFFMFFVAEEHGFEKLLKIIMWSGYIVALYAFLNYGVGLIISTLKTGERLNSSFNNVNEIASLCALSIAISLHCWLEKGFAFKYLLSIPSLLLMLACESRRALITLVLCVSLLLLLKLVSKDTKIRERVKIVTVFVLFVMAFFLTFNIGLFPGISERMNYLFASVTGHGEVDHSITIRNQLIEFGFSVFKEKPLVGIGMGCSNLLINHRFGMSYYFHNNFVELLACGGVIGFLVYYSVHFIIIALVLRSGGINNPQNRAVIMIMLFLLIADAASGTYYSKETYFLLMACVVHTCSVKKKESKALQTYGRTVCKERLAYK